ncbi:hypothetical protein GJV26_26280 [Massilia dura]|uniref:ABC-type transport auxiliary lipoprotein component domain-containing protein n=1 Tax=Pseudoduganella dura TaxID=321982 RepID=A0A6I3XQ52_9BURK|nr:PqiC family protein [Pseudoduganella dura]MUI15941.1 hypothetical protein [Pseudoduganella dura]GGX94733.1 hypothetical protein GCM10007386_27050 [Pseudoduganella dura]
MTRLVSLCRASAIAAAALLAGCAAAPADRFYTLAGDSVAAPEAVAGAGAGRLYIEMAAVNVPAQVRRDQLLVGGADGRVDLLEHHRWAGPLADEIGNALSLGVTARLGAIDVYRTPHPDDVPVYRISTNVQRFESVPGGYALVDAVWSVRQVGGGAVLTCRSVLREEAGQGYEALVAGHRAALGRLAAAVAAGVRDLAAGRTAGC